MYTGISSLTDELVTSSDTSVSNFQASDGENLGISGGFFGNVGLKLNLKAIPSVSL